MTFDRWGTGRASRSVSGCARWRHRAPKPQHPDRHRRHRSTIIFCLWAFEITWERLTGGLDKMAIVIRQMVTWKDFWTWDFSGIALGLAQTLGMAFLGTLHRVPFRPPARLSRRAQRRRLLTASPSCPKTPRRVPRRRPAHLGASSIVRAVGLGPLAGVLAIMTSDTGILGKLYSEAVENIDKKQVEGVKATGAPSSGSLSLRQHSRRSFRCFSRKVPVLLREQHPLRHHPRHRRRRRHRHATLRTHARAILGSGLFHYHPDPDHGRRHRLALRQTPHALHRQTGPVSASIDLDVDLPRSAMIGLRFTCE